MKRDFDLIRSILLQVEAAPAGQVIMQLSCDSSISEASFAQHIELMIEKGLLDGEVNSHGECWFCIQKMTWEGHDFLDAARSDLVWNEAKSKLLKVGGAASLEVVKAVLIQIVKSHLGLPMQ